jgi:hypothetical protein
VLVLNHYSGRGKTSGLELAQTSAKGARLFHLRGGKVTRLVTYAGRERALADVGLAAEAGSPRHAANHPSWASQGGGAESGALEN